jgi:hypothetical protein
LRGTQSFNGKVKSQCLTCHAHTIGWQFRSPEVPSSCQTTQLSLSLRQGSTSGYSTTGLAVIGNMCHRD